MARGIVFCRRIPYSLRKDPKMPLSLESRALTIYSEYLLKGWEEDKRGERPLIFFLSSFYSPPKLPSKSLINWPAGHTTLPIIHDNSFIMSLWLGGLGDHPLCFFFFFFFLTLNKLSYLILSNRQEPLF